MSSLPSSSSSSDTPAELINKILNTEANKPDFDLTVFVAQIDLLLLHYEAQLGKKNPIREQLGDLPSEASNFVDQMSTNVTRIANEDGVIKSIDETVQLMHNNVKIGCQV
ncbi:uncharacterized protein LOC131040142 [Cryptomeria japonica]|uniref:uncharacterized protein LOC131040142 n=1 Tax=Cryptomeria japonica TaxID=3369 RepID=UPI0025AC958B|nr:uncharacterized protein LOC131040142 [Cryptomeria japonica]